jgi:hypothetical protein
MPDIKSSLHGWQKKMDAPTTSKRTKSLLSCRSSSSCLTTRRGNMTSISIITNKLALFLLILIQTIEIAIGEDSSLYKNKVDIGPLTIYIFDVPESTLLPVDTVVNVTYSVLHKYFAEEVYPTYFDLMSITLSDQKGIYMSDKDQPSLFHVYMNGVPQQLQQQRYGNQATLLGWIQLASAEASIINGIDTNQINAMVSSTLNDTSRYLYSLQQLEGTEFGNVVEAFAVNDSVSTSSNRTTASPTISPQTMATTDRPTKKTTKPPASQPQGATARPTMVAVAPTNHPHTSKPKTTKPVTTFHRPTVTIPRHTRPNASSPYRIPTNNNAFVPTAKPASILGVSSSSSPNRTPYYHPNSDIRSAPLNSQVQREPNPSPTLTRIASPATQSPHKKQSTGNTTTSSSNITSILYSQADLEPTQAPTAENTTTALNVYKKPNTGNSTTQSENNTAKVNPSIYTSVEPINGYDNQNGRSGNSESSSLTKGNLNQVSGALNKTMWIGTITIALLVALFICCVIRCYARKRVERRQSKKVSSVYSEDDEANKVPSKCDDESTHSSSNEKGPASWEDWGYTSSFEADQKLPQIRGSAPADLDQKIGRVLHQENHFQPDFSQVAFEDAAIVEANNTDSALKNEQNINELRHRGDSNEKRPEEEHGWIVPTNFVLESPPRVTQENDHISYVSSPGQSTLAFSIASTNREEVLSTPEDIPKRRSLFRRLPLSRQDGAFPTAAANNNPYYANNHYDLASPGSPQPCSSNDTSHYFSSDQSSALHPLDWSNGEVSTLGGGSSNASDMSDLQGKRIWDQYLAQHAALSSPNNHNSFSRVYDPTLSKNQQYFNLPPNNYESPTSEASFTTGVSSTTIGSDVSRSKELIQDILWLEKKIADRTIITAGALATEDHYYDYCSEEDTMYTMDENAGRAIEQHRELRCRDCFAPPGKLNIIIRSSVDGPVVHTVDQSSALYGQLFTGNVIIAVDDVDTRNMRAEAVMKLMHSKVDRERKITVLHLSEHAS